MNTNKENKIEELTFGERLKRLRSAKGLSQTELGKLTETHYTQIGRYERGESTPSSETLRLLADCLEVSTDYLYEGNQEDAAVADLSDRELLKMFKETETLSNEDKELVKKFLGAFLIKKKLQEQLAS